MSSPTLAETIQELYDIVNRLESSYTKHNRHFTLDGHLLGSIGEVYAAEHYGIELAKSSEKTHDGITPDGRLVQIKVTQRSSIGISSEPKYLIVLHVSEKGEFEEVYNGPGHPVWSLVKDKRMPKNGQYQIALSRLRALDADISDDERVQAAE